MIEKCIMRDLILKVFEKTPQTQITSVINDVETLVKENNLFPSEETCQELGIDYRCYRQGQLNSIDKDHIIEIAWDLLVERVITPSQGDRGWPFLRLASFGHDIISQSMPHYNDPQAYIDFLKSMVPNLDHVVEQYIFEGLNCFRRQLFFASAVMFGAAAEKIVLLLLETITGALTDPVQRQAAQDLLERPRLPSIYDKIRETLNPLVQNNTIPYAVHQGCNEHLVSLFEMIRVQRNDAVHPAVGSVNRQKVFISLQVMPAAIEAVYKLMDWLRSNPIVDC